LMCVMRQRTGAFVPGRCAFAIALSLLAAGQPSFKLFV
jgi:hypothetical protein